MLLCSGPSFDGTPNGKVVQLDAARIAARMYFSL